MRSSGRRGQRRDSSGALAVLGNVLLVLATLGVAGLVAYLVLNPPGVLEPASGLGAFPSSSAAAPPAGGSSGAAPPQGPATSGVPGQLSLDTACGAISPLLDRADEVRVTATDDVDALVPESISDLTRDLQTLSESSPPELSAQISPLTQILLDLNNELLANKEVPDVNVDGAEAATTTIRDICK